ncbi:MAG: Zn-dependent alcohol dehydrogenase [Porticoccaceae bacterium]|nr:MAG: Zn-dependent alcohol dehydrogenase [Porticoccaceae bacterium]
MRAAVYPGGGRPLVIERLPDPIPGPGELLVRIHRCGICGTDLTMTKGGPWDFPPGTVPGHEYAGEVVALGKGVQGFRVGDRITALPSSGCGRLTCLACREGNLTLCRDAPGVMGGFGEYLRVPQGSAVKLPAHLSLADGALVEPLAVGLYGVRQASLRPGERVLVMGGGTVALATLYWARRSGAGRIAAISRSDRRRELALQFGADAFLRYGEGEEEAVREVLGGPPDVVFECVGAAGLLQKAIAHVRLFGRVVSLGFCIAPDPVIPAVAAFKAVTLKFPVGYTLADFRHVVDGLDRGHVDPKIMVTSEVPLEALPEKFEALRGPNAETKATVVLP